MKVLKKIKARIGLSNKAALHCPPAQPLEFHPVHGDNVLLTQGNTIAARYSIFHISILANNFRQETPRLLSLVCQLASHGWAGLVRPGCFGRLPHLSAHNKSHPSFQRNFCSCLKPFPFGPTISVASINDHLYKLSKDADEFWFTINKKLMFHFPGLKASARRLSSPTDPWESTRKFSSDSLRSRRAGRAPSDLASRQWTHASLPGTCPSTPVLTSPIGRGSGRKLSARSLQTRTQWCIIMSPPAGMWCLEWMVRTRESFSLEWTSGGSCGGWWTFTATATWSSSSTLGELSTTSGLQPCRDLQLHHPGQSQDLSLRVWEGRSPAAESQLPLPQPPASTARGDLQEPTSTAPAPARTSPWMPPPLLPPGARQSFATAMHSWTHPSNLARAWLWEFLRLRAPTLAALLSVWQELTLVTCAPLSFQRTATFFPSDLSTGFTPRTSSPTPKRATSSALRSALMGLSFVLSTVDLRGFFSMLTSQSQPDRSLTSMVWRRKCRWSGCAQHPADLLLSHLVTKPTLRSSTPRWPPP